MKRSIVFLLTLAGALAAQVQVHLILAPPGQFYVSRMWNCRITNDADTTVDVKLRGVVRESGDNIFSALSNVITINPGSNSITAAHVTGISEEYYDSRYEDVLKRRGALSAGRWTYCVYVEDLSGNTLAQDCRDHSTVKASKLRLLSPRDEAALTAPQPTFLWAPIIQTYDDLTYRLRIVEVPPELTSYEAISATEPWFEEEGITATSFLYPMSARMFEESSFYAWRVDAFVGERKISESETWAFTYGTKDFSLERHHKGLFHRWYEYYDGAMPNPIELYPGGFEQLSIRVTGLDPGSKYTTRKTKQKHNSSDFTLDQLAFVAALYSGGYGTDFAALNNDHEFGMQIKVPVSAVPGEEAVFRLKINRGGWPYRWVTGYEITVKVVPSSSLAPVDIVPGSLVWGDNSWAGNSKAPGIYGVTKPDIDRFDGKIVNFLYRDGEWQTRFCHWGGDAMPRSLVKCGNGIYGVNADGKVVSAWQEKGLLEYSESISNVSVSPHSLVWGDDSWAGDGKAPGIYGVTPDSKIVNFLYRDGKWQTRFCHWGGDAMPGSLVKCGNGIYGVNADGKVVSAWQEKGLLEYSESISNVSVSPHSLVWGDDSWAGDGKAPGIYGVTPDGKIVNFLYRDGKWQTRFCHWGGDAEPGSLVKCGNGIYGVNADGKVVSAWQEKGLLEYSESISNVSVSPHSLVWGDNSWAGNDKAPGIYGVTPDGKIVNFIWQNNQWNTRQCSGGGDAVGYSLIAGDIKVYGVDHDYNVIATWQEGGILTYSVIGE